MCMILTQFFCLKQDVLVPLLSLNKRSPDWLKTEGLSTRWVGLLCYTPKLTVLGTYALTDIIKSNLKKFKKTKTEHLEESELLAHRDKK